MSGLFLVQRMFNVGFGIHSQVKNNVVGTYLVLFNATVGDQYK